MSQTLLLGDSIATRLKKSNRFILDARGGRSAWDLLYNIVQGDLDQKIGQAAAAIILIGTNDIPLSNPYNTALTVLSCAQALVARKRTLRVIVCGILPRLDEDQLYQPAIKATNKLLEAFTIAAGFQFISVFKPFLYNGQVKSTHFSRDGTAYTPPKMACAQSSIHCVPQ